MIITIIVMLILVAVTISMAINGGLFEKAGEAVGDTKNEINKEQELASGRIQVDGMWYASVDDYLNNKPEPTAVYAKLYTDGTLILSSFDYTDETREVSEEYGDVSNKTEYQVVPTPYKPPQFTGDFPGWFGSSPYNPNTKINNVIIYDKIVPKTTKYWFANMENLEQIDLRNLDLSYVYDMSYMFCYGHFTSIDLSVLNTSKVTNNATNMSYMFYNCRSLRSLNLSNFDTSNVTDMSSMFYSCEGLTTLNLSNFDTSNVTNMHSMFEGCSGLTSLDLSNFDTSNVTNMGSMFWGCSGLTSLDLSNFDTSNVTNMRLMFGFCSGLTSLDLSNFDTSNVADMVSLFIYCSGLNTIYVSDKWSNESVTSSGGMFSGCTNLRGAISYNSSKTDATYANYSTGYFTYKEAPTL